MTEQSELLSLKDAIRDVPDFPRKGIVFKDLTTLIARGELLRLAVDRIADHYKDSGIQKIAGMESRGFIVGAPVSYRLGTGFIPVRKKGKLPYRTVSVSYDLEYGTDTLEIHEDAVLKGERILIVDDLLATGGTAAATVKLLNKLGAEIVGLAFLVELTFLEGRRNLPGIDVFSLLKY